MSIRSTSICGEETRGGVCVLIKHDLYQKVINRTCMKDQVWLSFSHFPVYLFGMVYIAPHDSPYYDPFAFAKIQEQVVTHGAQTLIIGDLNARIPNLSKLDDPSMELHYRQNPDTGANAHGRELLNFCVSHKLHPLNCLTLKTLVFDGGLTYKQGQNWKSQLDWVICSKNCLESVEQFLIQSDINFPSDHAPITVVVKCELSAKTVLERATLLNEDPADINHSRIKPMRFHQIDIPKFLMSLPSSELRFPSTDNDVSRLCEQITHEFVLACKSAKTKIKRSRQRSPSNSTERWANLLQTKDPKQIWKSINWSGKYKCPDSVSSAPNDESFAKHFEDLLNPIRNTQPLSVPSTDVYMPIMDDPISTSEVDDALRRLQASKAAGPDSLPPGILKHLPDDWIVLITLLFNLVFLGQYPTEWCFARLFTIYKKGDPMLPSNYRGISILNALCKVYDSILNRRLTRWFKPQPEQAGAQEGRGCIEQILCLRLLIDYARKSKKTLYIAFIDFTKAYDRVNRQTLLELLKQRGCGKNFLHAIANTLRRTSNIIGNARFDASAGVRQGGSCSCSLFTLYVDEIIRRINQHGNDDFLESMHCLMLMDDTAVLATSRNAMEQKLNLLWNSTCEIDMRIHPGKSQYIVINSSDEMAFHLGDITIEHTGSYTYLGTPISNKPMKQQIVDHLASKQNHTRKFLSFLSKNYDAPFSVKKTVWESAMMSAILYSAETWLADNLSEARAPYLSTAKALLGVRTQTASDLIYLEMGIPTVEALIKKRQCDFLRKMMISPSYPSSPLKFAIDLACTNRTPMGSYIMNLRTLNSDPVNQCMILLKQKVQAIATSRYTTYISINPELTVHPIYTTPLFLPEIHRIALTRLRLSSHHLRIETGRWSRTPREQRLCVCQENIQTEEHVLLHCERTQPIRNLYPEMNARTVSTLMEFRPETLLCKFVAKVLQCFQ